MAIQGLLQTVSQSTIESKRFSGELKRPQRHLVLSRFSADLRLKYSYDYSLIIEKTMLLLFDQDKIYCILIYLQHAKIQYENNLRLECILKIFLEYQL